MTRIRVSVAGGLALCLALSVGARAQVSPQTLQSISTPDKVETRLGTLDFTDGAPSADTVKKLYDNLDFVHGLDAFLNAFQGASTYAIHQGFRSIGVEDNAILIYSGLMDSKSLFLTANLSPFFQFNGHGLAKHILANDFSFARASGDMFPHLG